MMRRGFSMIETLITIALVALVFGLFMVLLQDSFSISRRMASRDEARRVAQVALDRLLTEASEADTLTLGGGPPAQLNLTKVYASDADRCPAPESYPLPDSYPLPAPPAPKPFMPFDSAYRRQVQYRLTAAGRLERLTGPVGQPVANPLVLATGLTGFSCQWASDPPLLNQQLLVIVLSYLDGKKLRTIRGMVVCPGIERN